MNSKGFPFGAASHELYHFAGSMEFVTVSLLCGAFNPVYAFLLALMVNARHLFYGISMLERFKGTGRKKWYLIFGMCDESFSILCSTKPPKGVDKGWFMVFVTLLNQCYWVAGATGRHFRLLYPFQHARNRFRDDRPICGYFHRSVEINKESSACSGGPGCPSRLPHRLRPGSIYSSVDGFDFNSAVPSEKAFK